MKLRPVFIVLLAVLFAGIVFTALPLRETAGLPEPDEPENIAELVAGLEQGDEESLSVLAERADALGFSANVKLAELSVIDGRDAAVYFLRALELHNDNGLRRLFAEWLEEQGDRDGAVAQYLQLLPDADALAALDRLDVNEMLILDALAGSGHWQVIAGFVPSDADAYQVYLGQALVQLGRYEASLPVLEEALAHAPDQETLLWSYARALEALGNKKGAMNAYQALGAAGGERLGRLYEQDGEKEKAARAYAQSGEPAALWRGAVLLDEMGDTASALAVYRKLAEDSGVFRDDALFRSYILLKENNPVEADAILDELSLHPAWMDRLNLEPSRPEFEEAGDGPSPLVHRLEAYREAERDDLATIELDIAWRFAPVEDKTALGRWYLEQSDYRQATRWGSGALRDKRTREAYELSYPRPFLQDVEKAAAEFGLEPELIWAVMREESRYQPAVASRVGAMGLMQIMPATGKEIAERLRLDFSEEDLVKPAVNIRFGAYYLRAMLDRFDQDLDKALSAYNAGPGNTGRWRKSILGDTPEGFPTAVTFLETREYITKVRDAYLTYRWLYSE